MLRFYEFSLKYSSVIGGRGENCSLEVAYYRPSVKNGDVQGYALFHCWDKIEKVNFAWTRKFYPDNFKAANVFHTGNCKNWKPGQKDTYVIMKKFFLIRVWDIFMVNSHNYHLSGNPQMQFFNEQQETTKWLLCCCENTEKATFGFVVSKLETYSCCSSIAWVPSM